MQRRIFYGAPQYKTPFLQFARYNRLSTGSIPKALSNCTSLEQFNVENNTISNLPDGLLASLENLAQVSA